ncbi:MAG: trypsin-like serine protease [Gammaproteobacteria bacterium]|nr:trypsin-like serine protease [Gammaproteobacteria bacterium]
MKTKNQLGPFCWSIPLLAIVGSVLSQTSSAMDITVLSPGCELDPPCITKCCPFDGGIELDGLKSGLELPTVPSGSIISRSSNSQDSVVSDELIRELQEEESVVMMAAGAASENPEGPLDSRPIAFSASGVLLFNWVDDERPKHAGVCSGTLIAPNLFITAAHCVQPKPTRSTRSTRLNHRHPDVMVDPLAPKHWSVFLEGFGVVEAAKPVVVHEDYIWKGHTTCFDGPVSQEEYGLGNDVAIIHLKENVTGIQPIPINSSETIRGKSVDIVSFGINKHSHTIGTKRKLPEIEVLETDECYTKELEFDGCRAGETFSVSIPKSYACHKSEERNYVLDTCSGDSGGSVYYKSTDSNALLLAGHVVGGTNKLCGHENPDEYSYFADYSYLSEFVEAQLEDQSQIEPDPIMHPDNWKNKLAHGLLFIESAVSEMPGERKSSAKVSYEVPETIKIMHVSLNGQVFFGGSLTMPGSRLLPMGAPNYILKLTQPNNETITVDPDRCNIDNPMHGIWTIDIILDSVDPGAGEVYKEDPISYQLRINTLEY